MNTESKRQQRFAAVLQQDLADLFQREGNNWASGSFITVTRVRVTPDLAIARIHLSFLQAKTAKEDLQKIISKTSEIRYKLGIKIRHDTRVIPQLEFFLDDTNEYVDHIDKIFDEINKDNKDPNTPD